LGEHEKPKTGVIGSHNSMIGNSRLIFKTVPTDQLASSLGSERKNPNIIRREERRDRRGRKNSKPKRRGTKEGKNRPPAREFLSYNEIARRKQSPLQKKRKLRTAENTPGAQSKSPDDERITS